MTASCWLTFPDNDTDLTRPDLAAPFCLLWDQYQRTLTMFLMCKNHIRYHIRAGIWLKITAAVYCQQGAIFHRGTGPCSSLTMTHTYYTQIKPRILIYTVTQNHLESCPAGKRAGTLKNIQVRWAMNQSAYHCLSWSNFNQSDQQTTYCSQKRVRRRAKKEQENPSALLFALLSIKKKIYTNLFSNWYCCFLSCHWLITVANTKAWNLVYWWFGELLQDVYSLTTLYP